MHKQYQIVRTSLPKGKTVYFSLNGLTGPTVKPKSRLRLPNRIRGWLQTRRVENFYASSPPLTPEYPSLNHGVLLPKPPVQFIP